jgi:hypothetical protein
MRPPRSGRSGKAGSRTRRAKGKTAPATAPMPKAGRPDRLAGRITQSGQQRQQERLTGPLTATPAAAILSPAGQAEEMETSVLALAAPDWLAHTLTVSGPADRVAAFRAAAAGPGILPLQDRARLEEDVMHALLAPPPALRGISLAGARILAGQIGDRIEIHASRAAGRGSLCLLDLNALIPVPLVLSGLSPDDPRLSAWLWRHWGTTWPLRQVVECPSAEPDQGELPAGQALCRYRFWSADWTPWPALATISSAWPDLRFVVSVHYGGA